MRLGPAGGFELEQEAGNVMPILAAFLQRAFRGSGYG